MLQQTRVSTVIPYFTSWIAKWPTVHDLARADHDDVLAAWKGLGYYSRATRLHEGAKALISQHSSTSPSSCPIPSTAEALKNVPGIGPYTAGAISSIAFGAPEPVLDGNVIRVLSRQLGIYADAKDKKVSDAFWAIADQLVKRVSGFPEIQRSKVPGQWNQALMELGSTVCTPTTPKCESCPIRSTCRAYAEGAALAGVKIEKGGVKEEEKEGPVLPDIEDLCTLCEQLDTEDLVAATPPSDAEEDSEDPDGETARPKKKRRKVEPAAAAAAAKKKKLEKKPANTISNYFTVRTRSAAKPASSAPADNLEAAAAVKAEPVQAETPKPDPTQPPALPLKTQKHIKTYISLFPKKAPKKAPAEQSALICLIENPSSSSFLIQQRPPKGLLASLWEFPQLHVSDADAATATSRRDSGAKFVRNLVKNEENDDGGANHDRKKRTRESGNDDDEEEEVKVEFQTDLGSIVHVFTHLRLTMHILVFRIVVAADAEAGSVPGTVVEGGDGEDAVTKEQKQKMKWVPKDEVPAQTLSTGMRRCWDLFLSK